MFQCHKSYIINLQNVVRIDKKEKKVYFENGESCFVSRRLVKELERLLLNAAEKSL
ncbi:MAG: LytTR family transcriptional regulator DNA-binding domain-containing protein [Lactobacillus sp.]|nr:LytTR family transcriptional regulator DNA-binding domain-containing protein [Lactobacillus sp.]